MDLYKLLKADHRHANDLFKQILQTTDRAAKTRQRLFDQLRSALELHGDAEEKHFYKALNRDADMKEMVSIARKDHREMRKRLTAIAAMSPGTRDFLDAVKSLQKQVRLHVREEEAAIFPAAKGVLDSDQAQKIAERIHTMETQEQPTAAQAAARKRVLGKRATPERRAATGTPKRAPKRAVSTEAPRAAAQSARSPSRRSQSGLSSRTRGTRKS